MIETKLELKGDDLVVTHYQDAEDIAERAKMLREQPNRGDFHHVWSIPNAMVVDFYQKYCGNVPGNPTVAAPPMDQNFWDWVHKKMRDPENRKFWCHDKQSQFRVGYESK